MEIVELLKKTTNRDVVPMKGTPPDPRMLHVHQIVFNYPTMSTPTIMVLISLFNTSDIAVVVFGFDFPEKLLNGCVYRKENLNGVEGMIVSNDDFRKIAQTFLSRLETAHDIKGYYGFDYNTNFKVDKCLESKIEPIVIKNTLNQSKDSKIETKSVDLLFPFKWIYSNKGKIFAWFISLVIVFFVGKLFYWLLFVPEDHEKFSVSSGNIILYMERDCKVGCKYDPYVTFINQNNRDVSILTYHRDSETHYITKKDLFTLKAGQKLRKYIGLRSYNYLYSIDAVIQTDQGTAETIQLWDH